MTLDEDVSWTVQLDGTSDVVADWLVGPTPPLTRGSEPTLTFVFSSSRTVAVDDYRERYRQLRSVLDYTNGAPTVSGLSNDGTPWYRERVPSAAVVDSFLVGLEPGADVVDAPGMWALLVGGEDASQPVTDRRELALDLIVLAELDEYADHQAVRDDLAAEVV